MSSLQENKIIHIVVTEADIFDMVEEHNNNLEDGEQPIDIEKALEVAQEWGRHIEQTASSLCFEQLESVLLVGTP